MSLSRLRSEKKTRPLTAKQVIERELRGYPRMVRFELTNKIYGALKGKNFLKEEPDGSNSE